MNYKLIASDLDGTLLYDVFNVSRENMDAIREFSQMGGYVVPTSGRCFYEIVPELRSCEDIKYCISSNGAVITDLATGERDQICITPEKLKAIVDIATEYEVHLTLHRDGYGSIDLSTDNRERAFYYNLNEHYFVHYHKWCRKVDGLADLCRSGIEAEMISLFFRKQSELDECAERLGTVGGLILTSSADFNIEIVAEGASKGDGIRRLAKKLGLDMSEVIAVGDSRNDVTMLKAAGLGLAVSNAVDGLKQKADAVICSHKEHIIPYILKNFVK